MADKEATVYVLDVGKSMGNKCHGRDVTDFDWGMKYVWDKIATTVGTGRKTLCAGVVAFRSDDTKHDAGEDSAYDNISVLQPLGQILMPDVRVLHSKLKPSQTDKGDALSALIVAIQMIIVFCKKLKYTRKIILVTNGTGVMDSDDMEQIVTKIKEDGIELVILGADFDDPQYGYKEEDKNPAKAANEEVFDRLVNDCGGVLGTLDQAVSELGIPRVKSVKAIASFKGQLTLGDPETYETALSIDVERYPRTIIAKPPSASSFVIRANMADDGAAQPSSNALNSGDGGDLNDGGLTAVHNARTYQVKDEEAPGGKRDVERDDLAKGYEYGRTAVHIGESEENVTKLETKASLDIIGFIPMEKFDRYMALGRSYIIIAQRTNERAAMALSSFIHALYELDTCAVARLVVKDGKGPILTLLTPSIEPDYECLTEVELPFAEDVRAYKFPPLDRIVTVSGKVLTEHRNLPSADLKNAMEAYVNSMDLSTFGKDEEGKPCEYMPPEDTYSPLFHRLTQAIRYRAVHPNDPVPPANEIITQYSKPPDELLERNMKCIERLRAVADVKKIPPKLLSKRKYRGSRADETPRSGLDISALLSTRTSTNQNKITPENAIPDFRQVLDGADDVAIIERAVKQFSAIIEDWIKFSLGDAAYDRAIEGIGVMKKECIEMEEPGLYNDFMRSLKGKLLEGDLGGDRREMWWKVRGSRLGLIDKRSSEVSTVTEEEAKVFLDRK